MRDLGHGLWTWTARHPEWHGKGFASEVRSYAYRDGDHTLLIDPLVVEAATWEQLDGIVNGPVDTVVSLGYHARSSEAAQDRYGGAIYGPANVASRLRSIRRFKPFAAGDTLPVGVIAHPVGNPRRTELPLEIPGLKALVFGDAVVEYDGKLRVWVQAPLTEKRLHWFHSRLAPSVAPLADLDLERVLVTHGEPVLENGAAELRAALGRPWYHRE